MSTPKRIHHINILVRDLDSKATLFETLLGKKAERHALQKRQVETASFRLGDAYLVLVMPTTTDSVVADILKEKGEGLFLLSLGVSDLESAIARLHDKNIALSKTEQRTGINGWKIQDVGLTEQMGFILQLTEN